MSKKIQLTDRDRAEVRLDDKHVLKIHAADEGIVLDVWPDDDAAEEPVWSTYHFYNEMLPEENDDG